jgi:hypothetical protein
VGFYHPKSHRNHVKNQRKKNQKTRSKARLIRKKIKKSNPPEQDPLEKIKK